MVSLFSFIKESVMSSERLEPNGKAALKVPKSGYGGREYPIRGALRGHEGHWFRVKKGRHNHRVARIGADGLSEDRSFRVRASDFLPTASEEEQLDVASSQEVCQIRGGGIITIAPRLRALLGLREGDVLIQEATEDAIMLFPAEVVRRKRTNLDEPRHSLDGLLERVTGDNIHAETPTTT
jgi:bifunctional DNA-binding transcriptional regulator/antitoxin component of YhaV-PrlF toxin-antitoxin module